MAARLVRIPGLRAITEPIPAQVIAALVMIVWHAPALYDATLHNEELHIVEHLMFIGSGLVLYWPLLEATSSQARWRMSEGAKLVYMLLATLPQDAVALVLIFSRVPFYEFYTHAPRLIEGYTPLIDQTIAGAVLMIFGKVTLGIAAAAIFFRWFGAEHRADRDLASAGTRRNSSADFSPIAGTAVVGIESRGAGTSVDTVSSATRPWSGCTRSRPTQADPGQARLNPGGAKVGSA
jgi:cytochrome c oxidase assembly factor CtaG